VPLGWRLYLPGSWANDVARRREAGIPEEIVFRKKWELALEIIDQIRGWGLPARVVVADAGYGDGTEFREELEKRGLSYAVGVGPNTGVWLKPPKLTRAKGTGKGRPPSAVRYGDQRPLTAQEAVRQAKGWKKIRWREGSKGRLESRFWTTRAQPSHRYQDGRPPGKEVWLLIEWPESERAPTKYWLCDLPVGTSLRRIVRLVKCRWKIEQDYHQLKEELGLDHYEGRNWQGWHHHVTMVMLAHAFLTLETLRSKKNFWVDPAEDAP
jgi:SRSO17 transposase